MVGSWIPMVFYHDPENDLYAAFEEFRLRQEIYDIGRMATNLANTDGVQSNSGQLVPVPEPVDLLALLQGGGDLIVTYKNPVDCNPEDKRKQVEFWKAYEVVKEEAIRMMEAGQGWTLPGGEG